MLLKHAVIALGRDVVHRHMRRYRAEVLIELKVHFAVTIVRASLLLALATGLLHIDVGTLKPGAIKHRWLERADDIVGAIVLHVWAPAVVDVVAEQREERSALTDGLDL